MNQTSIITNILEEMNGQLVVGNWLLKINSSVGAIANIVTEKEKPTVRSRSNPLVILQERFDTLLNREESVLEVIAALEAGESVEFYSPIGFGKTVLLRYLARDHQVDSLFGSSIISLSPIHPNVSDILDCIWNIFYESNIPYKATYNEILQQIQEKQALIVLDDQSGLIQNELEELMNAAGNCTFLIASLTSRVKKKGRSILLSGLPINDALALVERELQRSLRSEEQSAAKSLCTILKGHPTHIQIAVASIVEQEQHLTTSHYPIQSHPQGVYGSTLAEVVSQLPTSAPGNYLIQQIVASLSTVEKTILDLLTVMGNVGLESEQVTHITGISDAFDLLERLRRRHLVQLDGSRYYVSKTIVEVLPPEWNLTAPLEKAIAYFVIWAERHQQQPNILLLEVDAIVQLIEVAVRNNRWKDVIFLVKAVESTLALSKQWGLWGQVLQRGLQASQAERDEVVQAWTLHQLGTRALCLEENTIAQNYLNKAIELRKSLGDNRGVAASRHNLSLIDNPSMSSTQTSQQTNIPNSDTKDFHSEASSVQPLFTRMTIVSSENASSSSKPVSKNVLLSPKGIITTGILASGGLFAWLSWHHFIPVPSTKSITSPTTTAKPSPIPKITPKATATPLPNIEPVPTTSRLSPLPEVIRKISPPITPNIDSQQPILPKRERLITKPAPVTTTEPTIQLTPDTTVAPTPDETTPTSTFPPSATPSFELTQPTVEPTTTPTTPTSTPEPTPTLETIPTPAVTVTPLTEPTN